MLVLSPADRAALWHQTVVSDPDERQSMLRVLAKEIQDLLASDLSVYSDWDDVLEATLLLLDKSGLIGRDDLRQAFEVVGLEESEEGIPGAEFALHLAGALEESASFDRLELETRASALELARIWREVVDPDPASTAPSEPLTVAEVAVHFGVTPQAVYKWCESGKIEFERTPGGSYRIPASQFDWGRGKTTEKARREVALRLLRQLEGTPTLSDDEIVEAMRAARNESS